MYNNPNTKGQIMYDATYPRYVDRHIHEDRKQNSGCQGLEGAGDRELVFRGQQGQLGKIKTL